MPNSGERMILSRLPQLWIGAVGISLFVWAYVDPRFRDSEGFLEGNFCLPLAVGVALLLIACTRAGQLKRFAFWFALALVGQAATLQIIDAGPLVHYQQ
jgi:hypothetical protein